MINSSSVTSSNIFKLYFQAALEHEKQEKTLAFKMCFAENVWLFQTNVIISFSCILRSNISFINHTFVYVLRGGGGAGGGGLGRNGQGRNLIMNFRNQPTVYVSAMIFNFIIWVLHNIKAFLIPVCLLIFQIKHFLDFQGVTIYLGRSFQILHVWMIDGRL